MNVITFRGEPVTLTGNEIKTGQAAPNFTLTGSDLNPVQLADFEGKVKIISVFPSIDTGVCALQTKRFNSEASKLSDDIVIICVSKDLPFAQSRFCGAEGIDRVVVLSDYKTGEFGERYGFLLKELGLLTRGVIVVDKDNVIQYVEYVSEIAEEPNYRKAIDEAKNALHYSSANLAAKLESVGLTGEQLKQTLDILKNHLERRLPPFIAEHIDEIFAGAKLELSDIVLNEASSISDEIKEAFAKVTDFFAKK
jgi:thiol peroxidase